MVNASISGEWLRKRGISVGNSAFEHASFYYRHNEMVEWAQSSQTVRWKSICTPKAPHKNTIKLKTHRKVGNLCELAKNNIFNHIPKSMQMVQIKSGTLAI